MTEFTRAEKSLLLYFETCLVDSCGKVISAKMNEDDFKITKKWKEEKFIEFQRIPFNEINKNTPFPITHTIRFTNKAWELAHQYRRERAERMADTIGE